MLEGVKTGEKVSTTRKEVMKGISPLGFLSLVGFLFD